MIRILSIRIRGTASSRIRAWRQSRSSRRRVHRRPASNWRQASAGTCSSRTSHGPCARSISNQICLRRQCSGRIPALERRGEAVGVPLRVNQGETGRRSEQGIVAGWSYQRAELRSRERGWRALCVSEVERGVGYATVRCDKHTGRDLGRWKA